jgi:hypothetical protein
MHLSGRLSRQNVWSSRTAYQKGSPRPESIPELRGFWLLTTVVAASRRTSLAGKSPYPFRAKREIIDSIHSHRTRGGRRTSEVWPGRVAPRRPPKSFENAFPAHAAGRLWPFSGRARPSKPLESPEFIAFEGLPAVHKSTEYSTANWATPGHVFSSRIPPPRDGFCAHLDGVLIRPRVLFHTAPTEPTAIRPVAIRLKVVHSRIVHPIHTATSLSFFHWGPRAAARAFRIVD